MTETSPVGSVSVLTDELSRQSKDLQFAYRARAGRPVALVDIRVVAPDISREVPPDDRTMGELQVRGPFVASAYYAADDAADRFTADGWFRTGDIGTVDTRGYLAIRDRAKDVIKSGGEWISSVALENAIMGHPAVAEAAVVGLPHPTWDERPLALVVKRDGAEVCAEDLARHLHALGTFPRWWLPDGYEFVPAIPRTSVGKFRKTALREQYRAYFGSPELSLPRP